MHRIHRPLIVAPVCFSFLLISTAAARADDWPQWRGPDRDGVWKETGLIETFDGPSIKPVWKAPISSGYSGPTVADGRVYVTDRVVSPEQIERVLCFDAKTGKRVWEYEYPCPYKGVSYDAGPRASVLIHGGLAYSLGAMGNLFCFKADDGKVVWKKDCNTEYDIQMPIWGISASPIIEGDLLIAEIGGKDACFVAFDRKTGEERWKALPDRASYSAPIIIDQAGRRVMVCWTGDNVVGLDPKTGKTIWIHAYPSKKMVMGVATPVLHDDELFITGFFDGALMLRLDEKKPTVKKMWEIAGTHEDTRALHSTIGTPIFDGRYIYGVDSYGELRCLNAVTGDRVWEDLTAVPKARWSTIHFVRNGDRTWMFNERGDLIIAKLSPSGYEEISRTHLIDPTEDQLRQRGGVCWSHPAFANRHVFARNDKELVCANLAKP